MHPFDKPFYGGLYKVDENMPEQFHAIPVHGFQEISLHHHQPFLHFLHNRASVSKPVSWGDAHG
jgi:hypothetical protein